VFNGGCPARTDLKKTLVGKEGRSQMGIVKRNGKTEMTGDNNKRHDFRSNGVDTAI